MIDNSDAAHDFEAWLTDMPEALDRFLEVVPEGLKLDFSADALGRLEEWLLGEYESLESYVERAPTVIVDGVSRYIGETLRTHLGGCWDIILDNRKNVYFGMPVLIGAGGELTPVCPHFLATTLLDRRSGKFLGRLFLAKQSFRLSD